MKKLTTRKKILIASLLVGVLVVGAIVSLVLVLAAQTQGVSSTINVTYVVEDVGAKVSARYAVVKTSTGEVSGDWVNLVNGSETEHEFDVGDDGDGVQLNPTETEVKLSSSDSTIVYEYKFTNTTASPFTIELTNEPDVTDSTEVDNMTVAYKSSAVEMSTFTSTTVADGTLKTQLIIEENATTYLYVKANVSDLKKGAYYTGNIEWTLSKVDSNDLQQATLNNDGGEGATAVKFLTGNEYQLPHLTTLPTSSDATKIFNGYKNGDVYVYDANGTSNSAVIPTNADTYTAEWVDKPAFLVSATGELLGINAETATAATIDIPNTVKTINTGVLSGTNAAATTINIPNSVTTIGASAFEGNTNVQNIIIEEAEGASAMAYADGDVLTTIGASAFKNCSNLKHLVIPSNVTSVPHGENAILNGCRMLESLTINCDAVPGGGLNGYSGIDKLFGLVLNEDEWIAEGSQSPNTLKTIIFNGGTSLGIEMFGYDSHITTIVLPDTLTEINHYAFYYCSGLTSVTIPNSVTSIGYSAFDSCISLTSVTIPDSVTSIGDNAFYDCSSLTSVIFENTSGWFYASSSTATSGISINVSTPSTNATNLKDYNGEWYSKYLKRS